MSSWSALRRRCPRPGTELDLHCVRDVRAAAPPRPHWCPPPRAHATTGTSPPRHRASRGHNPSPQAKPLPRPRREHVVTLCRPEPLYQCHGTMTMPMHAASAPSASTRTARGARVHSTAPRRSHTDVVKHATTASTSHPTTLSSTTSSSPKHTVMPPQGATSGTPSAAVEPSGEDLSLKPHFLCATWLSTCPAFEPRPRSWEHAP